MREQAKPGVTTRDLRPCACCKKPLLQRPDGFRSLQAYRVTTDALVLDAKATRQYAGLAMMFGGNERLADAFCSDQELLKCYSTSTRVLCQECYTSKPLAEILEEVGHRGPEPQPAEPA